MKTTELKIARIGNSKGVRVPAVTLRRYGIGASVLMEERIDGIMLRPAGPLVEKLSWEDTAREIALSAEDWSEWDRVAFDGLEAHPWDTKHSSKVAERDAKYKTGRLRAVIKRYEIRWADLEPAKEAEMTKGGEVVIVSLDVLNRQLQTVTACPLTTSIHPTWSSRLQVRIRRRDAEVAVDQMRTISKCRLGSKIAVLSEDQAALLRRIITEMYGE